MPKNPEMTKKAKWATFTYYGPEMRIITKLFKNKWLLRYNGQTEHTCKAQYREHIQAIRTDRQTSKYARHILDVGHTYSTIKETMEVLQINKKGQSLNTLKCFHTYTI
jgi:hypothetical protein